MGDQAPRTMEDIDPAEVPTSPAWVLDMALLEHNLKILHGVQRDSGATILLALKGFATWAAFGLVSRYLKGATASSPFEARLAREELGGQVHVYAPAYSDADMQAILPLADHLVFNSLTQWERYQKDVADSGRRISCGLRLNPEHREVDVELYDPCAPRSRLGVTRQQLDQNIHLFDGLEGLHFHNLCELGADALERTLKVVEARFQDVLSRVKWVNFGGGHHITRPGYDTERLVKIIQSFKQRYGVEVILEPGEAIAIRTGVLVASVLDIVENQGPVAILDISATCHMPDVLEMPYRPEVLGAGEPGEKPYTYRLAGLTCLAGDVIGDYAFDHPLAVGQRLSFLDMSHYTLVKTSSFNGVGLPALCLRHPHGSYEVKKRFGYECYRDRLS